MKTKRTNMIALLCAAGLLFVVQAFAQDFPSYLTMEGTKITGCDKAALPANLVIPDGVTEIERDAFEGCTSLLTVSIPASVMEISLFAFRGCDNIKTVQYRGTLVQWCTMDNDWQLIANAKTITMSDIVDLKAMTTLAIPDGVAKIGMFAFAGYYSLESVTLPDGVTEIGAAAFAGCKSLASVSIPASVIKIGDDAFRDCYNMTVQYRGTLAQWCQIDDDGQLVTNAKTITMSDIVDLKAMTALAIPNGVTKIGGCTFYGCKSLANVSIPTSVTEISWNAFCSCYNIKTVQYRGSFAQWCQMDNDNNLVANAKTITMSDLTNLKAMTALAIPDDMTKIGRGAFAGCTSLASVSIPASVTEIGNGAFSDCHNIKTVQYKGTLAQWCQTDNDTNLAAAETITMSDIVDLKAMTALTIPDGVTKIGREAFFCCASLATVSIPASVTEIGKYAFYHCSNIKTVQYRGTLAQWCQMDNDSGLVANAKTLTMSDIVDLKATTELAIPDGVMKISVDAFRGCTSLTSVTIPRSVTEIGSDAFSGCTSLASVTISRSVTEIGSGAFSGCTSLASVTIPRSVTEIGNSAFSGCTSLASVTIPTSAKKIGMFAFQNCKSLKEVKYLGTKVQWNSIDKGYNWNLDVPAKKVVCKDGEADLD